MSTRASVIVLGYGQEAYLEKCLGALVADLHDDDELVLVDNGVQDAAVRTSGWPSRVRVINNGQNLGFAGGCNYAADHTDGEFLVFVNSDAILRRASISSLVAVASEETVGLAGGCLRLAQSPDKVNSVGNPLQYLGLTWAGSCGEPASAHQKQRSVAVATGGFFAIRRQVWDDLHGFDSLYFAYHEDTDLSLRCWMSGRRVQFVPQAIADHHYEFGRSPEKMYLVERNRILTVLTDYPPVILGVILPMLLILEPAFFVMALIQGWQAQKLRSWRWLIGHRAEIRLRRRRVQRQVRIDDVDIAALMCARIDQPMVAAPPGMSLLNALLTGYWVIAHSIIRRFGAVRNRG